MYDAIAMEYGMVIVGMHKDWLIDWIWLSHHSINLIIKWPDEWMVGWFVHVLPNNPLTRWFHLMESLKRK